MPQLNPKVHFAIALAVALIAMAAQGTVSLPMGVPEAWGAYIVSWSNFVIKIYAVVAPVMIGFGLNFTAPNLPIATVTKSLAFVAILCMVALHVGPARADPNSMPTLPPPIQLHVTKPAAGSPAPALTGNPVADFKNAVGIPASSGATGDVETDLVAIEKAISQDLLDDLTAAQAAYASLGDVPGGNCNQEILAEVTALKTAADAKGLPKMHMAFDFAIARTLVLAVSPNSKLNVACAPVVEQTKQSVLQLVTGIIGGSATILPALGLE